MEVEVINAKNPCVLISRIPTSCGENRQTREHEAGIHLLYCGMGMLNLHGYEIHYSELGKPFFAENDKPSFNISHSNGYVACAISIGEIGCDIEKIRRVPRILDREISKIKYLCADIDDCSILGRTRMWTIYESVAKCLGRGIPINPDEVKSSKWRIHSWIIKDTYVMSTAEKEIGGGM